jgi:GT2 family glycosyltransferase
MIADTSNYISNVGIYRQKIRGGFPATCNIGIKHAQGDYVCLLNTDTWVTPGWIEKIISIAERSEHFGILGPSTNSGKQVLDYKKISRMYDLNAIGEHITNKYQDQHTETYLSGFCFVVKKQVFDKVGLLDERFGLGTGEEGEFTTRAIDAGYKSVWVQGSYVHHFGGKSFKADRINGHRLRKYTQDLANALTDQRRGLQPKHDIEVLIQRIQSFNR